MPLHEYLEQKRRQNITQLNASGACHICGSTGRNSRGFSHFIDNEAGCHDAAQSSAVGGGNYNELSMVPPPNLAPMRTCSCFGISPSDSDYWPYSIRVCDKCIEDDKGIGRIRNCGVCGTVACDENCGPELLECTDCADAALQAGCLECRGLSDFSDLDIFRKDNIPQANQGEPRMTRICIKCLEQSTPWVKYDFVCRRFRCETKLCPSDVAEKKRFCTFGSSPLNLLPEDGLVAIVDFLSGSDLRRLFLTCSAMCTVAERVAKEKVERVSHEYPTGPIVIVSKSKDGSSNEIKYLTRFAGTNEYNLRAPDDNKAWVGVYHYLEKATREMFSMGFQLTDENNPQKYDIVGRYINQNCDGKFTFGQTYSNTADDGDDGDDFVPCANVVGLSVRGGCVLVNGSNVSPVPFAIASSRALVSGTHRVICRVYCPGTGGARGNRDARDKLGSIGILRTNQPGDGPTTSWTENISITEAFGKEEVIIGLEYNADTRELCVHANPHLQRSSRYISNDGMFVDEEPGDLHIAVELTAKAANTINTLMSIRNVSEEEWAMFINHTTDGTGNANRGEDVEIEILDDAVQLPANNLGEHRQVQRLNRRRDRNNDEADDGGNFQPIQFRALEGGVREARLIMPRAQQAFQEQLDNINNLGRNLDRQLRELEGGGQEARIMQRRIALEELQNEQNEVRQRLVVGQRLVAEAAAMAAELEQGNEDT